MLKTKTLNNIPETGFCCSNEVCETAQVTVSRRIKGLFKFSKLACRQLLAGACDLQAGSPALIAKLGLFGMDCNESGDVALELCRDDVRCLKQCLENRMAHCEKQRDERDDQFNADTYIMQKMLLLELREWLLGEEVPCL